MEHCIQDQNLDAHKRTFYEYSATGHDTSSDIEKRPIDTINMDLETLEEFKFIAKVFFKPGTKEYYHGAGKAWRAGILCYEPLGSGKTSFAITVASHCDVPLGTVSLGGSSDEILAESFAKIQFRLLFFSMISTP